MTFLINRLFKHFLLCQWNKTLIVCPKFWKTFKNEASTNWELINKQGRVSKVELLENDKDSIVIYKDCPEFRRLSEIYDPREIMFIYMGDRIFHVRFFKGDLELSRAFKQLQEKNTGVADIDDLRLLVYQWRMRNCKYMLNASKKMIFT